MAVSALRLLPVLRLAQVCRLWLACLLLWGTGAALGQTAPLRIGVLAFQGKEVATAQWAATADHLSQQLAPLKFEVVPLTYDELNTAVKQQLLDFVLTNPEHYVALRNAFHLRPLLTVAAMVNGQIRDDFGSVIFSLASSPVQALADVRGRRVAAVGLFSLGGFLMAADEFRQVGIDLRSSAVAGLHWTGVPHQNVVREVLDGRADVGIVRSGVLERMASLGELDLKDLRVLNAAPEGVFPLRLSTALYPEWPFAAAAHTPGALVKKVTLALLAVQPGDAAAHAGRYHGFYPPASYAPVEDLMKRLKVFPQVDTRPLWEEIWAHYEIQIELTLVAALLSVVALTAYLWRGNLRLRQMSQLYQQAQGNLQITAAAFNSQVGLLVTDEQTRIIRANAALCDMLGYAESDLVGRDTSSLRGHSARPGFLRQLWEQLGSVGKWQGELPCQHRQGHDVPCMVTITAVRQGPHGVTGFIASFADVTRQKQTEAEIRKLAYFDILTALPNRRLFLERLQEEIGCAVASGRLGALMFIDLDHFKTLNDTHGHSLGDQLLQHIARRLQATVGEGDLVARLGGDEFVVMLTGLPGEEGAALEQALAVAQKARHTILQPYELQVSSEPGSAKALAHHCSGSVGVALFGHQTEPLTEVLKRADVAMYQAKQAGRNAIRSYDASVQMALSQKGILSADLSTALVRQEMSLHYQLQTDAYGTPIGAECLLRWQHPVHGMVSPVEFVPLAEESGAIVSMGHWVLQTACETLADWARHPGFRLLSLSVNVSPRQFIEADFVARVQKTLQATGAPPDKLILEITEGIVLQSAEQVIQKMHELCALGLGFSIDDFGTGYSSMSYLQRLPLRQVKIDKAFVRDVTYNPNSEAIVRAILALGHSMHLTVVSEGVETPEQKKLLVSLGCDALQGYLLGRPVELAPFNQSLALRVDGAGRLMAGA